MIEKYLNAKCDKFVIENITMDGNNRVNGTNRKVLMG
jgi:hypothetical protein